MKKILVALGVIVALCAATLVLRHLSLTRGWCSFCKTVSVLLWKPSDYYAPLARVEANAVNGSAALVVNFVPRYHGAYMLALERLDVAGIGEGAVAQVRCAGSRSFVRDVSVDSAFASVTADGRIVTVFRVPEDLERGGKASCEVLVRGLQDAQRVALLAVKLSDL